MAPRARLRGLACAALLLVTGLFAATAAAQNATTVTITGSRPATFARVGQVLTFNVQLYTGNTPINSLTFTSGSPTPMSGLNCPGVPADLLTTTNCTFTYTTTSMDMAMGTITALGRWTATRPGASRSGSTNTLKVSYAPPREPDAPVVGTAVAGDSQATVAFSAPYFDGGWPVDGYTVTASPGGKTANGTASPITVTGLTNGTAYQFTVSATNVIGTGTSSATSNIVTPTSPQTITFANPGSQDFGTTPTLAATASSGLAVAFSSGTTDVCTTTSGGALTLVAAGTCTINANQAGNAAFAAAPQVSQSFSVNAVAPGAPVIGTATVDGAEATVAFTPPVVSGGTAVTSYTVTSSPGALTATGSDSPITLAGLDYGTAYTFTVTATNPAGTGVASAASNAVTPKASQAITFNNPGAQAFGTSPTLTATSSAGLAVSFSSATTGVCTIDAGGTLTFVTAGTCTVEADQPGDAATLAATTVSRSFTVTPVVPGAPSVGTATAGEGQASVTFTAPAFTGGAAIIAYTVTSTSGGATATGAASPITVTGLTNGTAYAFTVTATNTAGTGAASAATNMVTPASSQTITFGNPGAQNYGTSPTLTATSSSGLPVAFTSSSTAVCTITTGGALTFVAAGTCSINADQAGDSAHLPAPQVSRSFSVNPVAPGAPTSVAAVAGNAQAVVSFDAPANVGGAAITGYTVTSSPGGVIVSGAGSPITVTGLANGTAYTFTVTASNSAGTGSASVASNTVTPAPPLVARPVSATLAYDAPASPVALDITGTPTGVAVDSAPSHGTAVATGTTITYQPTAGYAGPDSFTYTASDGINTSASATVTITVAEPTLALAPAAPPAATGSTAYAHAFAASGGAAPYTFVLASGALPDGLVLDADGTLSGTPVQDGSFSFTIEATDSSTGTGPFSARQAYTLDVQAPAIAFALSLPEITFGDHIEQTVQASGGTAPYTFAVLGGELPPGVALSTAGLLSGAPEAAGRFEATIEVRDANDFAAQRDIELLIERAAQAITGFTANPSEPVFAPAGTFELSAQGGTSGNPIVFASTTPAVCTVEADTVTMRAAGRCSLTADQAGDANRDAAPQVALDVDIAAAVPTLVWPEQLSKVLGEPAFELDNPESDSAGAFTFGSSQPDVASISGRTVTLNGPGTAVITATQAADGSYAAASIEMQLVVVERPDPTRDPGVTGLLQAQVDASVRFANAQQANIRDRLRQVRSGSNASSGNLTLAYAGGENAQGLSMPVGQAVSSAWPAMSPGWGAWLSGTATFGSNGRANGFDFETDGITLGVDRAIGGNLLVGIAGSLATNQSELDDNASRLDADQRSLALYGLWRAGEHVFVDGMVGTGRLDFDIRRWSNDADALGTAARDGDQWFASLATGYEHHGPSMTLTGYGRLDTSRTTLDGYREFGLDLHDLEYRQQVVENSTVAVGLEGNWRIGGDAGRVSPFWSVEYREALQNQGEAAINYVIWPSATDYRLRMDSYNDHALALSAGLDVTLRRGWLLSVLLGHEQARNASDASSIGLRLSYSAQPIAIDPVVSADEVLSGPPDR